MARHFRFFVNGTRAYTLTFEKDLLGDWVVRRTWGSQEKPYSRKKVEVFNSETEAFKRFELLVAFRLQKRHYTMLSIIT